VFRYRTGVAGRDLPGRFGPWQTVWKRHHRFATDGTWDKLLRVIQAEADAAGRVDWNVSVDSSIVRAHQHSATATRSAREDRTVLVEHTGAVSNAKNPRCCRDETGRSRPRPLARRAEHEDPRRRRRTGPPAGHPSTAAASSSQPCCSGSPT